MTINWRGHSCFEITTFPAKNSQVKILIDPFSREIGLRVPKLEADIVLITHNHPGHNNFKAVLPTVSGHSPFLISGPGEYEIKNIFIQGIQSWHSQSLEKEGSENTIYTLESEDLKLCHLGDLGQKELTDEQLDKIGEIDILMAPVGGVSTISTKEALKIMSQIEPKIIIPMHYQMPKLKMKLEGLDKFLKSVGIKKIEPLNRFSVKKKDLSPEEAKIIVLKP